MEFIKKWEKELEKMNKNKISNGGFWDSVS